MKNKLLAIFGIGTFIFGLIISATTLEGELKFPVAVIIISEIASLVFIIMAVVRLWKEARYLSILLILSAAGFYTLELVNEISLPTYGSRLIILWNVFKVFHLLIFSWVVIKLFTIKNPIKELESSIPEYGSENTIVTKVEYEAAKERLRSRWNGQK